MYLLCLCGLLGMAITGDAFNIFVFMEVSSLAMYTLIALGSERRALVAAFQYLVIGTLGATFYVILQLIFSGWIKKEPKPEFGLLPKLSH